MIIYSGTRDLRSAITLPLHVRPNYTPLLSFYFFRSAKKKKCSFVELDTEDPSVLPGNSDVACACSKKPGLTPLRQDLLFVSFSARSQLCTVWTAITTATTTLSANSSTGRHHTCCHPRPPSLLLQPANMASTMPSSKPRHRHRPRSSRQKGRPMTLARSPSTSLP